MEGQGPRTFAPMAQFSHWRAFQDLRSRAADLAEGCEYYSDLTCNILIDPIWLMLWFAILARYEVPLLLGGGV